MNDIQSVDALLNADLSNVETGFPVIEPGVVSCIVAEMKQGVTKEKQKPCLNIKLTTAHPVKTTKGEQRPAGFPLTDLVSLEPTRNEDGSFKYDPRQRLAQIKEAVFGTKEGAFGDPATYVGKPITVRIKIESDPEFGDRNRIAAYVKLQH